MTEKQIRTVVGDNVRGYREQLDISQEELAALSDVHRTYIGRLERGERAITTTTLVKIAKGLGLGDNLFLLLLPNSAKSHKRGQSIAAGAVSISFADSYSRPLPKWLRPD